MNMESPLSTLILASGSSYRKSLLTRLGLPFRCEPANIEETPRQDEMPSELVSRLAGEKARAIARKHPEAVVIGSDQVAVFDGRVIGKPGDHGTASAQLSAFSGREIEFLTCAAVVRLADGFSAEHTDRTGVWFRVLQSDEIERYLRAEQPYDCAGSFKSEALGITLFESIQSGDPSALVGLPLIHTAKMLRRAGFCLP